MVKYVVKEEGGSGSGRPFTRREAVKDPMQMQRAGILIVVAGVCVAFFA